MNSQRRSGLTLLELLVSVSVVAILTGITIVAVRGALIIARDTGVLNDLRSTSQQFHSWSLSHRGQFLNVGVPRERDLGPTWLERPDGSLVAVDYLGQWHKWHYVMEQWTGKLSLDGNGMISYGMTFITDPSLWTDSPPPWSQRPAQQHWREVFIAEAAQPSNKGMLLRMLPQTSRETNPRIEFERYYMAFVDHSAGVYDERDLAPLTQGFLFGSPPLQPYPVHDTLGGALGRDVTRR